MRTALLCALLLVAAAPASAALPKAGALVPGRSLGGVRLGETAPKVRAVELVGGRVSGVYTIWEPNGWRTPAGLRLGASEADLQTLAGPLVPIVCSGYDARVRDETDVRTVYYVLRGRLWGFGLLPAHANPCR
jgi:hypothetical protein